MLIGGGHLKSNVGCQMSKKDGHLYKTQSQMSNAKCQLRVDTSNQMSNVKRGWAPLYKANVKCQLSTEGGHLYKTQMQMSYVKCR